MGLLDCIKSEDEVEVVQVESKVRKGDIPSFFLCVAVESVVLNFLLGYYGGFGDLKDRGVIVERHGS